jgi:glutamate-1-semialdehyde 2,1-aminomutase
MLGNCGGIMPEPGWLETIRHLCDEYGIVMIMDEVKTGFRLARGGAQEYFGVKADLVTYAKALGNGYPIAAFGGQRDIMEQVGQGVSHGGTFTGNRLSLSAANATLDILGTALCHFRPSQYVHLLVCRRSAQRVPRLAGDRSYAV